MDVVAWTNEEGSRFRPAMVGSGVFAGEFTLAEAHARRSWHRSSARGACG